MITLNLIAIALVSPEYLSDTKIEEYVNRKKNTKNGRNIK